MKVIVTSDKEQAHIFEKVYPGGEYCLSEFIVASPIGRDTSLLQQCAISIELDTDAESLLLVEGKDEHMFLQVSIEVALKAPAVIFEYKGIFIEPSLSLHRTYNVALQAPEARANIDTRVKVSGKNHFTFFALQDHYAPHSMSNVSLKGVALDRSKVASDTLIRIGPGIHGIKAYQMHKNIMKGPLARATAHPRLEVLSDEVQCGHGAAISFIDPQALWYLQSRGIEVSAAEQILIDAFLAG